jgi:O-antigen/teichoic acid export membrane protein
MLQKVKSFLFHNSSVRQTVAKNAFWLTVSNFGGRFIRAAIIIYAARVLGPAEWGVFNYAITIVAFLTLFVDSGANQVLIRDRAQAQDPDTRRTVTATTIWLKATFVFLGAILILFVAPLIPTADAFTAEKAAVLFPIVVFIMIFDNIREFFHAIFRSEERMEWEAVCYGLTNVFIVAFGFLSLFLHPTVRGFAFGYMLGTGAGAVLTFFVVHRYLRGSWFGFSWPVARRVLGSIWPYAISGALGMLMINTDIVMLGWLRSAEEVGWYSAPQRIIQLIYLVPAIMSVAVLPAFARLVATSREKMALAIEYSVGTVYMAALPITFGGIIVALPLIELFFGEAFVPAAPALQILLLTLLADFSAVLLGNVLLAHDHQRSLVVYSAIGGFANIALNLIFIPRFGVVGCAIATLCAQLMSNAYLQYTVRRLHPFHVVPHLTNAVLATIAMVAGVLAFQAAGAHVLLTVAAGGLMYGGVLYARREPLLRDLRNIVLRSTNGADAH